MTTIAVNSASAKPARRVRKSVGGLPLFHWLTRNWIWDGFILLCIIANAVILGVDAHLGPNNPYASMIEQWNMYFLFVFTFELVLEFFAQGPRKFFGSGWNWFDLLVVGLSYIAYNPAISALRALRVVRVFRLVSAVPQMRRVVEALFGAMPGILASFAILAVVFYIAAVMGTTLFRQDEGFQDLGASLLSLFALSQFDGWGDTIRRLQGYNPYAWIYVLGFTVIARSPCSTSLSASSSKRCRPRRRKRSRKTSKSSAGMSRRLHRPRKMRRRRNGASWTSCALCAPRSRPCAGRRRRGDRAPLITRLSADGAGCALALRG
jgi:voltage-gated sodium channel